MYQLAIRLLLVIVFIISPDIYSHDGINHSIKGKSIRLDSGAIVDAEITYEILAIEDGSSINGIVKKIVNSTPTKKQILPEDKKKEDK